MKSTDAARQQRATHRARKRKAFCDHRNAWARKRGLPFKRPSLTTGTLLAAFAARGLLRAGWL